MVILMTKPILVSSLQAIVTASYASGHKGANAVRDLKKIVKPGNSGFREYTLGLLIVFKNDLALNT